MARSRLVRDRQAAPCPRLEARGFPFALVAWGMLAVALDIGVARITYGTALPAIRRDLGLTYTESGFLGTANLAAYLVGTLAAPWLARRAGMRKLASSGHLAFAAGAIVSALAPDFWVLGSGRIVMGLGAGVGLVGVFVLVFAHTRADVRPIASMAVWSGIAFAIVASALSAPWLLPDPGVWRIAFLLSGVLGIAAAVSFHRTPAGEVSGSPNSSRGFRRSNLAELLPLFASYLLFGSAYIAYSTFVGTDLAARGASVSVVVWTWLSLGVGSVAGSICGLLLLASRAKAFALAISLLSGALGTLLSGSGGASSDLGGAALVGVGLAFTPAVVTALVRERTSEADYPRLFSYATGALGVGLLVGPAVAGWSADLFGTRAVTVFAGLCYVAGTTLALLDVGLEWRRTRRGADRR